MLVYLWLNHQLSWGGDHVYMYDIVYIITDEDIYIYIFASTAIYICIRTHVINCLKDAQGSFLIHFLEQEGTLCWQKRARRDLQ